MIQQGYRAVIGERLGSREAYRIATLARAPLAPGEVRLAVAAAGVSFVDVLIAAGGYQMKPPLPFTPGTECSGTVLDLAPDVEGLEIGDRVAAGCGLGGAFAEEAVVRAEAVIPIPDSLSFAAASTSYVSYQTAYHALVQRAALRAGETLLVLGASGGVGAAAVEIGRELGAAVIASASTPDKRTAALTHGATHAIDSGAADWRERVATLTKGRGVDVVVDPVGGDQTERAFRSLAWGGRHLVIGFSSGGIATLRTNLPLLKGAALAGVDIRQFREREPERARANLIALNRLVASGVIAPAAAHCFPLEEFAAAMALASSRERVGRIALQIRADAA